MKITKRQLRRIIRESILCENLDMIVKKYAGGAKGSMNDHIAAVMKDPELAKLNVKEDEVIDAVEAYWDKIMGLY